LVSFSRPPTQLRRILIVPVSRSIRFHRIASSSARRTPVTITSHTRVPQLGSSAQAASMIRAACSTVGGSGSGGGLRGFRAISAGFRETQPHRSAAAKIPRIAKWIRRIVAPDSGLH
jgi:hypothetical protein